MPVRHEPKGAEWWHGFRFILFLFLKRKRGEGQKLNLNFVLIELNILNCSSS